VESVEARLEPRPEGLTPVTDGWFVVNVRDAAWVQNDVLGSACIFEGDEAAFPQLGYTIAVLEPGSRAAATTARRTRRTSSCSAGSACWSSKERSGG